jgi:2-haloacid dehalogenase
VLEGRGFPLTEELSERYHAVNRALWARYDRGEVRQDWLLVERFAVLLRELGSSLDPAALNRDYLRELGRSGVLLPGAEQLCRTLADRCTLAIVTNGASVAQRGRFDSSPIRPFISGLFISEELGYQKPQREFFDVTCREMGISDRARAVVVGDNLRTDIQGGINAGLDTIWYNPGRLSGDPTISPVWQAASFPPSEQIILNN